MSDRFCLIRTSRDPARRLQVLQNDLRRDYIPVLCRFRKYLANILAIAGEIRLELLPVPVHYIHNPRLGACHTARAATATRTSFYERSALVCDPKPPSTGWAGSDVCICHRASSFPHAKYICFSSADVHGRQSQGHVCQKTFHNFEPTNGVWSRGTSRRDLVHQWRHKI